MNRLSAFERTGLATAFVDHDQKWLKQSSRQRVKKLAVETRVDPLNDTLWQPSARRHILRNDGVPVWQRRRLHNKREFNVESCATMD